MVKLLINKEEVKFETTIFPDGTSQVWKLGDLSNFNSFLDEPVILWLFESEAELFHVLQLSTLLQEHLGLSKDRVTLRVPYLPYGRQDKDISNVSSFALTIFKEVLYNNNITRIETFDAHSKTEMVYPLETVSVVDFHKTVIHHDLVCYPDKGAATRYSKMNDRPYIYAEKVRDQLTGNITGLNLITNGQDIEGKTIAIVDDICDGGMTFIKVAEAIKPHNPKQIDLVVSHGIFSKGKRALVDAGITEFYTTNSLLKNTEGFKVW